MGKQNGIKVGGKLQWGGKQGHVWAGRRGLGGAWGQRWRNFWGD